MTDYAAPVQGQTKTRPTGVTILSILYFLQALIILIGGVVALGVLASLGTIGTIIGSVVGGVMILIGLIQMLIAWGLWSGKGWARIIAIIFTVLGVLANLMGALDLNLTSVVGLLIGVVILWYLFQPQVKAYYA